MNPRRPLVATVTLNPSLDEWVYLVRLQPGALNRATGFARYPGGKGINVSRVVHELGGRTIAFGLAGGDDGTILRHAMRRLSIAHRLVTIPGSTRNNYKIRTESPRALTEINTAGPRVPAIHLRTLASRLFAFRPCPRYVVLSGSLPPGVPQTIYARWIRAMQRRGIPVLLDTSGEALRFGLRAGPWCIKPNRQEAEELLGRRLRGRRQLVRAVQELRHQGAVIVMLSLGAEGALMGCPTTRSAAGIPGSWWDGQTDVWWATPPSVRVDSTVGAGDSLIGGFLVGWMATRSLLEAFRCGIASGAATAMTPGTELCHRRDVQRLLRRVRIQRLV